jgi:large subunit ribosomal protein L13
MIINAKNHILGRIATVAAKKAKKGEEVHIINCRHIVITGKKEVTLKKYKNRRSRGAQSTGPHFPRTPKGIMKRTIRGMLPYKKPQGRAAFERIKCYNTTPRDIEESEGETIKEAHINKTDAQYITLNEISNELGGKQ